MSVCHVLFCPVKVKQKQPLNGWNNSSLKNQLSAALWICLLWQLCEKGLCMYCCHKNSSVTYCIAATIAQCNSNNFEFVERGKMLPKQKSIAIWRKLLLQLVHTECSFVCYDLSIKCDFLSWNLSLYLVISRYIKGVQVHTARQF